MEREATPQNLYATDAFETAYTYAGNDLGTVWTPDGTRFRGWAPTADAVSVRLYASGDAGGDDLLAVLPMRRDVDGTWVAEAPGNLHGVYYTYAAEIDGETRETCDPYARAVGVNGERAMVIDLASTNPPGWDTDVPPHAGRTPNDAVLYELHVRDLSSDGSAGIMHAGKFLGLTETGTTTPGGVPTGLDHIVSLGVTHVHLLPVFDYGSVDEARPDEPQYNWGYDPVNYNVPEGSYATDPRRGEVRVAEMKRMVRALHARGLGVVMDVVYNHVYDAERFCVNRLVPGYFSRIDENGRYANGSGCRNDTASERRMVRKFIVDSVKYWADEYHIDGFRFDLVGLLDIRTVNEVVAEVHKSHPDVIFYGEGWTMPTAVTRPGVLLATQANAALTPNFAYFNDDIRNALRSVGTAGRGLNEDEWARTTRRCVTGMNGWCPSPAQSVNYASCHDNHTLMDHLSLAAPDASLAELIRMNELIAAVCFTAQGIPFLLAGEEMLRVKRDAAGVPNGNSYNAPDAVNSLKWRALEDAAHRRVFDYYRGLIAFRKMHGALRLTTAEAVRAHMAVPEDSPRGVVTVLLDGDVPGEPSDGLLLVYNVAAEPRTVQVPAGVWDVCVRDGRAGIEPLATLTGGPLTVEPLSVTALVKRRNTP